MVGAATGDLLMPVAYIRTGDLCELGLSLDDPAQLWIHGLQLVMEL